MRHLLAVTAEAVKHADKGTQHRHAVFGIVCVFTDLDHIEKDRLSRDVPQFSDVPGKKGVIVFPGFGRKLFNNIQAFKFFICKQKGLTVCVL